MSIRSFLINVADFFEGVGKKIGLGDKMSADIGNEVAAVLGSFIAKWKEDINQILLANAKPFADGVLNDPSTFLTAAEALLQKSLADGLTVTIDDARDAIRVHVLAAPKV